MPRAPAHFTRRIRVLLADTQPLFRDSLERALAQDPTLELMSHAGDASTLLATLEEHQPDVALIDESLVELASVGALATRVILLAATTETARAFSAIECGAAGYLLRDGEAEALREAIVRVADGETVLDPCLQTGIAREVRLRGANARPVLSPREREILQMIAEGSSAPQIGRALHLSPGTVKTHILHIYDKLGVSERAAAVAQAMRQGLLE